MEALRRARCPRCGQTFYVCESCWRGQVYCSRECSAAGRERCVRHARRRYRHSPQGRRMHRRSQNRYRQRLAARRKINVTDHPSQPAVQMSMLTPARDPGATEGVAPEAVPAKEYEHERHTVGDGSEEAGCPAPGMGVAGAGQNPAGAPEDDTVASESAPGVSGSPVTVAGSAGPRCRCCGKGGWVLSRPSLPGPFRARADCAGAGFLHKATPVRPLLRTSSSRSITMVHPSG